MENHKVPGGVQLREEDGEDGQNKGKGEDKGLPKEEPNNIGTKKLRLDNAKEFNEQLQRVNAEEAEILGVKLGRRE